MSERKKISFAHGQELSPDDAPALPLWVDGHAYLLMADRFFDVRDATGRVLRRVPLYGEDAVAIAMGSTARAVAPWRSTDAEVRATCFRSLGELLERYASHLVRLLSEETAQAPEHGASEGDEGNEIAQVLDHLKKIASAPPSLSPREGLAAVLADVGAPLAAPLVGALDAVAAGWGVVLKPSPKAPSALFACAELFSRAGFPKGVVNCIHGDEDAVRALLKNDHVTATMFAGAPALADRLGEMVRATGQAFVGGAPGEKLQIAWRDCLTGSA